MEEAARILHKIGVEVISGGFAAVQVQASGLATEVYATGTPAELSPAIEAGHVQVIDVQGVSPDVSAYIFNARTEDIDYSGAPNRNGASLGA